MNWKFWKRATKKSAIKMREDMEREEAQTWAEIKAEKEAKAKAEWDALPDHRKAARIEYRYFNAMAKPKKAESAPTNYSSLSALQNAALQNQQFGSAMYREASAFNPYIGMYNQMNGAIAHQFHAEGIWR